MYRGLLTAKIALTKKGCQTRRDRIILSNLKPRESKKVGLKIQPPLNFPPSSGNVRAFFTPSSSKGGLLHDDKQRAEEGGV
jgi:hypothetical protein